jgi:hypothetical protein
MAELRHYPPAVLIHVPHCREGEDKPTLVITSVTGTLPNHRLHFCFPEDLIEKPIAAIAAMGVVPMITFEVEDYGDHIYVPVRQGKLLPDDAIDYPCKICRGTHGGDLEELQRVPPTPRTAQP